MDISTWHPKGFLNGKARSKETLVDLLHAKQTSSTYQVAMGSMGVEMRRM